MKSKAIGLLGLFLLAGHLSDAVAHHAVEAKFDPGRAVTLSGVVTKVDWRDPHVHVFMNVENGADVLNWAIELESPDLLRHSGWSPASVRPGDGITVDGIVARNGSRQAWANSMRMTATGRAVLVPDYDEPPATLAARPTPRWPDGQPRLGPLPGGAEGYWAFPSARTLMEDGVDAEVDRYGLLADIRDASKVAPFQPWAEALYVSRQSRFLADDPTYLMCKPPGGPRQFQEDQGIEFVEDRDRKRIFILVGSGNHNFHIAFLDGREPVGQVGGDDDNPLYYGRSVGAWQGDTLVLETTGFNEDFWFTRGGLPHTDMLKLTERFSRPDFDTLRYQVTVDDPGAYTRPWTATWTLKWVTGEDLPFHLCQENRP